MAVVFVNEEEKLNPVDGAAAAFVAVLAVPVEAAGAGVPAGAVDVAAPPPNENPPPLPVPVTVDVAVDDGAAATVCAGAGVPPNEKPDEGALDAAGVLVEVEPPNVNPDAAGAGAAAVDGAGAAGGAPNVKAILKVIQLRLIDCSTSYQGAFGVDAMMMDGWMYVPKIYLSRYCIEFVVGCRLSIFQ